MDTHTVGTAEDLADCFKSDAVEPEFDTTTAHEAFRIWEAWRADEDSDARLVTVPYWYAQKEFGETVPPLLVASVEYDNPQKGAVLFDRAHYIDTNICKNEAFDFVGLDDAVRELDMTDKEEANHDDAGMIWLPRSLMTVIEYDDTPSDSITNIGT